MPKKTDGATADAAPTPAMSDEIITVHGGEPGLPVGLTLGGPMQARRLPDGTLRLIGLPPSVEARYYPDLAPVADPVSPAAPAVAIDTILSPEV